MTIKTLTKGCFLRFIFIVVLGGVGFFECSLSAFSDGGWGYDSAFFRQMSDATLNTQFGVRTEIQETIQPRHFARTSLHLLSFSKYEEGEGNPPPLPPANPFLSDLLTWGWSDIAPVLMAIYNGESLANLDWVNAVEARLQRGRINNVPVAVMQRFSEWPVLAIAFHGEDGRSLIEALSDVGYNPEMANNLEIMLGGAMPRYAETISLLLRIEDQRERFQLVYAPSARFTFFNRPPLFPFIWTGNLKLVLTLLWTVKDAGPHLIWLILTSREPFLRDGASWKPVNIFELLTALKAQTLDDPDRPIGADYEAVEQQIRRLMDAYTPFERLR